MRCGSCGLQSREGARFCDGCGARLASDGHGVKLTVARECISCGKEIDLGVYFTICPHCGFNYRIEVKPVCPRAGITKRRAALLYAASLLLPTAGFVAGGILSRTGNHDSQRIAGWCVAMGAVNIVLLPILVLGYLGMV